MFLTFRTRNRRVFHILHAAKVCITGISPAKNDKYSYFVLYPYNNVWVNLGIINMVSLLRIFVLRIDCNCNSIPRSLIPSSSCLFLPPKCPCNLQLKFKLTETEMHKSQLWALVIVFWLVFIAPNFGKLLSAQNLS